MLNWITLYGRMKTEYVSYFLPGRCLFFLPWGEISLLGNLSLGLHTWLVECVIMYCFLGIGQKLTMFMLHPQRMRWHSLWQDWCDFHLKWSQLFGGGGGILYRASAHHQYVPGVGKAAPVQWSLHVSSILLVWPPERRPFSEASPPSMRALCLYWKNAFVEKDKLSSKQMRRMENRSGSQCGKVIYQLKMCLLTDKPIRGRQMPCLWALKREWDM